MPGQKAAKRMYRPKLLDFTMSSNQVPADVSQLSAPEQLIYEKILEVRDAATSENPDSQKQYQLDLLRAGVEFGFERDSNISALSSDVNTKVLRFVDEVLATAAKNNITWLTRDKVLSILSPFNQRLPQQALILIHENISVYRYNKNRSADHLPIIFTIQEDEERPYILEFDGMKVTLKFNMFLHYHAGDFDPENKASLSRDLAIKEQFSIDFSALSPDEGQGFLSNKDAITQDMQIKVVNPNLYVEVSDTLTNVINESKHKKTRGFMARIFSWLSSLFGYSSKNNPKIVPKAQEHVLPKIDPIARNEDHTEPGIWQAIKRKLYIPQFLARKNDTADVKNQKTAPKMGRSNSNS